MGAANFMARVVSGPRGHIWPSLLQIVFLHQCIVWYDKHTYILCIYIVVKSGKVDYMYLFLISNIMNAVRQ